jgi:hypothetical protein
MLKLFNLKKNGDNTSSVTHIDHATITLHSLPVDQRVEKSLFH